jgi:hypothetical protein
VLGYIGVERYEPAIGQPVAAQFDRVPVRSLTLCDTKGCYAQAADSPLHLGLRILQPAELSIPCLCSKPVVFTAQSLRYE